MIALDTNVWVRYVTNDEPDQAQKAVKLLQSAEDVFLPKTVLLELAWVLKAVYGSPRESIDRAIMHIIGLPNVRVEAPQQVLQTLEMHRRGMDFADALHLAGSDGTETFYTFDAKFLRAAQKTGAKVLVPE